MSYISRAISIHNILDKDDWNYQELKLFLEEDASSVNERGPRHLAPLHRVLKNRNCSPDVIRLLVYHGADVNIEYNGRYLLEMLWSNAYDQKEAIIKALIEGGTDLAKLTREGRSLLCIALFCYDINIILMLIEAGCPLHTCLIHVSTVHCFIESLEYVDLNAYLLSLLIEKCRSKNWNVRDSRGRSLLCYALCQFPGFDIFNLILKAGCSWEACTYHDSPWQCATDSHLDHIPYLTNNFVQMLIDVKAESKVVNKFKEDLLNCALKYCSYEISAIQLMFDNGVVQLEGMESDEGGNALHSAFSNTIFNMDAKIVKLLVDRGADINEVDKKGYTPLHLAIDFYYHFSNLSAIEALLKNGALVNVVNVHGETPLKLALMRRYNDDVVQLLLNAGARINTDKWTFETLSYALGRYIGSPEKKHIHCCKSLLKHSLLDDPSIDISLMISEYEVKEEFDNFVKKCRDELKCMNALSISQHCTLYQRIVRRNEMKMIDVDNEKFNINQLINVLAHNKFPAYFDVICSTVDREDMKLKLQEIAWYAVNSVPETQTNSEIVLDCDSVYNIASYLSDEELFKLIICSTIS